MSKYYAVKKGHRPGIYKKWNECKTAVDGFKCAVYRKFNTLEEAQTFIGEIPLQKESAELVGSHFKLPLQMTSNTVSSECTCVCTCGKYPGISLPLAKSANISTDGLHFPHKRIFEPEIPVATPKKAKLQTGAMKGVVLDEDSQVIYTDGACENNGRLGSKGGIGVYWGPNHPMNVSESLEGRQTNNRAEIMAAVRALHQCKSLGKKNVTICTDSNFLIQGITQWINKWKRNGWKLATGNNVINKEDFEMLDEARQGLNVKWVHVRGHAGNPGNEAADRLAKGGVEGC